MIYTDQTKKAMIIAYNAHHGQVDKSGTPYIYHPIHLAEQMSDENTTCVALLHDVVEDTDVTLQDLKDAGFGEEIIEAVEYMTHDPSVPYMDYVAKIKTNPIARVVKLADLRHNSNPTRKGYVDMVTKGRIEKYKKAIEYLLSEEE
ncbi:MAG: HD domain-containing protein [Clostridiales bacterium]|nr:HD domain-containing protein [Clostridiales bacterium]